MFRFYPILAVVLLLCNLALPSFGLAQSTISKSSNLRSSTTVNKNLIIREVKIVVRDVFDEDKPVAIFRAANAVKINTKEDIVRRELLFKVGDYYDSFVLAESARNLRTLPFLRDVKITEVREGDNVDILVSVQDVWTLFPVLSLSSGSGTKSQTVGVTEGNLLGYGKRAEFLIGEDEGRSKREFVFDDRRFLGSLQRFSLGHFERSDGQSSVVSWGMPFRSLVNKEAWFTESARSDLVGRMFENSNTDYIYRQQRESFSGGYTRSFGNPDESLTRLTFGYGFIRDSFSEADSGDYRSIGLDPADFQSQPQRLADDRRFSGPTFTYQNIVPDFISVSYVDLFDRPQDLNLGNEFVVNSQIAPTVLGSLQDSLLYKISDIEGFRINPNEFIRLQVGTSGRFEQDSFRQLTFGLQSKYYNIKGPKYLLGQFVGQHTLAGNFLMESAFNTDNDYQMNLGATNGLRAYSDRTFTGRHKVLLNLEDRAHFIDDIGKLVSLGGAAFFDLGGVYDTAPFSAFQDGVYSNIGLGLRLGLPRSSGGAVIRIDLAVPLRDGLDGSQTGQPRLLITTGQLFNAFLRSDAPSLQAPSISAGFVP